MSATAAQGMRDHLLELVRQYAGDFEGVARAELAVKLEGREAFTFVDEGLGGRFRVTVELVAELAELEEYAPLTPADREEVYVGLGDFDAGDEGFECYVDESAGVRELVEGAGPS